MSTSPQSLAVTWICRFMLRGLAARLKDNDNICLVQLPSSISFDSRPPRLLSYETCCYKPNIQRLLHSSASLHQSFSTFTFTLGSMAQHNPIESPEKESIWSLPVSPSGRSNSRQNAHFWYHDGNVEPQTRTLSSLSILSYM